MQIEIKSTAANGLTKIDTASKVAGKPVQIKAEPGSKIQILADGVPQTGKQTIGNKKVHLKKVDKNLLIETLDGEPIAEIVDFYNQRDVYLAGDAWSFSDAEHLVQTADGITFPTQSTDVGGVGFFGTPAGIGVIGAAVAGGAAAGGGGGGGGGGEGPAPDTTAPVFTAGTKTNVSFKENATGTVYKPAATDNVGVTGYAFAGGADDSKFNIDSATGAITFKSPPDYEHPGSHDGSNTYEVKIKAHDAANNETTQTVTVTVTDVTEAATLTLAQTNDSIAENSAYTSAAPTLTGAIGAVTYTLSGADAALFTVDAATGVVTLAAQDFEAPADAGGDNVYDYTLEVTDADGNAASTDCRFARNIDPG